MGKPGGAVLAVLAACSRPAAEPTRSPTHAPIADARAAADAPDTDPAMHGVLRTAPPGHCGGAYMPDLPAPTMTPTAGKVLLVRRGDHNSETTPVAEMTTGADGGFRAALAPGRYCVVLAEQRDPPTRGGPYTDLSCLIGAWQRCLAIIDVPSPSPVAIDRQGLCFGPCYHGPMPP